MIIHTEENFKPNPDCKYQVKLIENGYSYYKCMSQKEFNDWSIRTKGDDAFVASFLLLFTIGFVLFIGWLIK